MAIASEVDALSVCIRTNDEANHIIFVQHDIEEIGYHDMRRVNPCFAGFQIFFIMQDDNCTDKDVVSL